jgi:hypothetical protein
MSGLKHIETYVGHVMLSKGDHSSGSCFRTSEVGGAVIRSRLGRGPGDDAGAGHRVRAGA